METPFLGNSQVYIFHFHGVSIKQTNTYILLSRIQTRMGKMEGKYESRVAKLECFDVSRNVLPIIIWKKEIILVTHFELQLTAKNLEDWPMKVH